MNAEEDIGSPVMFRKEIMKLSSIACIIRGETE